MRAIAYVRQTGNSLCIRVSIFFEFPELLRRNQKYAPTKVKEHAATTAKDAALHIIFSICDGKLKFHAKQWNAPNNAPAMTEEPSRGLGFASSL